MKDEVRPVVYENGEVIILDQTELPGREVYVPVTSLEEMYYAIKTLAVRGAPNIGIAAAYGLYAGMKAYCSHSNNAGRSYEELLGELKREAEYLKSSRPTAVDLMHMADRVVRKAEENSGEMDITDCILKEAQKIETEEREATRKMGECGMQFFRPGMGILTHCNAGKLAAEGLGTATSSIYLGHERGYNFRVYADETRPLLQGARLTSWELNRSGVDVTLICDNMASSVMKQGLIDAVVVGADRIAMNGDTANKIGTSGLAIIAREYGVPFYVFAPVSTIDPEASDENSIPIEQRDPSEVSRMWYKEPMAPEGVKALNPAFDVTRNEYITAIVTERGAVKPPFNISLKRLISGDK